MYPIAAYKADSRSKTLLIGFEACRNGGDDEATQGAVTLDAGVGGEVLGALQVLFVFCLPVSETVRVLHLRLALSDGFGEQTNGGFAGVGEFALVGVEDGVNMCAADGYGKQFFLR